MKTISWSDNSFKIRLSADWVPAEPNFAFAGKEGRESYIPGTSYHLFTGYHPVGGNKLYLQMVMSWIGGSLKPGVSLHEMREKLFVTRMRRKGDLVVVSSPSSNNKHCVIYRYNRVLFVELSEAAITIASSSTTVLLSVTSFRMDEPRLIKEVDAIFQAIEVS